MDSETKDILRKVAEYGDVEKERLKKRVNSITSVAIILLLFSLLLDITNGFGFIPEKPCQNMSDFTTGIILVALIQHLLYLNGTLGKLGSWLYQLKK